MSLDGRFRRSPKRASLRWLAWLAFAVPPAAAALTLTTEEYPPFNYSADGGKTIVGSSSELLREALRRSALQATITLYPWQRAFNMALRDKDSCVYSTTRTAAREKRFKWVGPLADSTWVLFARADSPIQASTLAELKPFRIGGYQGDAKAAFLKAQGLTLDEAVNEEQNIRKLDAGRIELWAATSEYGPWYARKFGVGIKPVLVFQHVQMYAACNPAVPDDDIARLNDALEAMRQDGSFDRIMSRHR